jgi:hypothetical protein
MDSSTNASPSAPTTIMIDLQAVAAGVGQRFRKGGPVHLCAVAKQALALQQVVELLVSEVIWSSAQASARIGARAFHVPYHLTWEHEVAPIGQEQDGRKGGRYFGQPILLAAKR